MPYVNNSLPGTSGYHNEGGYLFIDNKSKSISLVLSFFINKNLTIAAGPALYFIEAGNFISTGSDEITESSHTKLGFTLNLALQVPAKSRLYTEVNLWYRKGGAVATGPYATEHFGHTATFHKTEVNYDHFMPTLGIGIRL